MSTSQIMPGLSEPVGSDKISQGTLAYICARNRQRQYDIVIREFKKSGITQKELADRLGSTPDVVSRLLARPGNWEADTFAKLMFAISGAVIFYGSTHPFKAQSIPQTQMATLNIHASISFPESANEETMTRIIPPTSTNVRFLPNAA